ncbi:MAG: hypothetical protein MOGMAGMI_01526 [Candidatus Omnitrophica bacterium]|nr:hypothetical protein [Candidatus Omnitrophota bacterium]
MFRRGYIRKVRRAPVLAALALAGAFMAMDAQAGLLRQAGYKVHDGADRLIADFLDSRNIRDIYAWRQWLSENIRYNKDLNGDDWSSPIVTLKRGSGDCEDYAILNRAVLRVLGHRADIYVVERWAASHAICIFSYDIGGTLYWGYTDNDRFVITEQSDFKTFTRELLSVNRYSGLTKYSQRYTRRKGATS